VAKNKFYNFCSSDLNFGMNWPNIRHGQEPFPISSGSFMTIAAFP